MAGITSRRTCKTPEKRLLNVENFDILYTTEGLCGHREPFLIRLNSVFPDGVESFPDKSVDEGVAATYDHRNYKRQRRARGNQHDHNARRHYRPSDGQNDRLHRLLRDLLNFRQQRFAQVCSVADQKVAVRAIEISPQG